MGRRSQKNGKFSDRLGARHQAAESERSVRPIYHARGGQGGEPGGPCTGGVGTPVG